MAHQEIEMLKAIGKVMTKLFSPYNIEFINEYGDVVQTLHAWTERDAVEWTACSLRDEAVVVRKTANIFESRVVLCRSAVEEV
jgi:hypothetical protein